MSYSPVTNLCARCGKEGSIQNREWIYKGIFSDAPYECEDRKKNLYNPRAICPECIDVFDHSFHKYLEHGDEINTILDPTIPDEYALDMADRVLEAIFERFENPNRCKCELGQSKHSAECAGRKQEGRTSA